MKTYPPIAADFGSVCEVGLKMQLVAVSGQQNIDEDKTFKKYSNGLIVESKNLRSVIK